MFDILSNHKAIRVRSGAAQSAGAETVPASAIDLFSGGLANRGLLVIDVSAVASGGKLDIVATDSPDNDTYDADFATIAQITAAGLYLAVIDDPERYLKFVATVTTNDVTWGAYFITFEEQRRPVTQPGTVKAVTYGTGRKPKVATA